MSALLQQTSIEVAAVGELVVLSLGNLAYSMEFDLALQVAADMTAAARDVKKSTGDKSRRYRVAGSMHDATPDKQVLTRFHTKLPERIARKDIGVRLKGAMVVLRLYKTEADIPYEAALSISQWLRVRAKEARNEAGEEAHWSDLVKQDS